MSTIVPHMADLLNTDSKDLQTNVGGTQGVSEVALTQQRHNICLPWLIQDFEGHWSTCERGQALEERSQTVLIVKQSAAFQVNGLSAVWPWIMCDFKGHPIA